VELDVGYKKLFPLIIGSRHAKRPQDLVICSRSETYHLPESLLALKRDHEKPSPLRILLADDSQNMRRIVTSVLGGIGIETIYETASGKAALQVLKSFRPDIAIIDYTMAPINGVEFTRLLRNSPETPHPFLPIVMISGHSSLSRVTEARDAGVNEFLVKPITPRALLERLESVVMKPRQFIRCRTFFGPDRRRRTLPEFRGPYRRESDETTRVAHLVGSTRSLALV